MVRIDIARLKIAALLLGAACGGSPPHGTDAGAPACGDGVEPIESFEHDLISAHCAFEVRDHSVATIDGCVQATVGLVSPDLIKDVQDGVIEYDPHAGFCCLQIVGNGRCLSLDSLACHDAFRGTLPAGAACTLDVECVSGTCARTNCGAVDCCPGACTTGVEDRTIPVGAPEGGSCAQDRCQDGLYCKGADPRCYRPAGIGGDCATNSCDNCTSFCDSNTKICRAPPEVGDPCTGVSECGLALNCVNGQCAVPPTLGEACVAGGAWPCQRGFGVYGSIDCINGVCTSTANASSLACASP